MKCGFVNDKGDRILIPVCMQVVHSNDIADCVCLGNEPHKIELSERERRYLITLVNKDGKNKYTVDALEKIYNLQHKLKR